MAVARDLPPKLQDDIAHIVLVLAGDGDPMIELALEEETDLIEATGERKRGDFATEDVVNAIFDKYRA